MVMKSIKITPPYEWRYNGRSPMLNIQVWCRQQFGTAYIQLYRYLPEFEQEIRWTYGESIFYFHRKEDYAWFMLKWS
jgi:hypothetical protein